MTSVQDWGWDFQDGIANLYLYSGGGECHCHDRVVHHVHLLPQSHPVVMATTTQQTAQRGRGLSKTWSNYARFVCFWYFQVFK